MSSSALDPGDFNWVRALLKERAAIVLDDGKEYLVETRLEPLARAEGLDLSAFLRRLRTLSYGPAHAQVVEALTTNETSFFRDPKVFQAVEQLVVPELLPKCKGRKLRIWSAACSTGQEPYTLAMILFDSLKLNSGDVEIIATDISTQVLEKAALGEFSQLEVNRGLPAKLLAKCFERAAAKWRAKAELRSLIKFQHMNLIEPWNVYGSFDMVFLRNVLIYFDVDTKRKILAQVRRLLSPSGYLFLGTAETTIQIDDGYERVDFGAASAYRLRDRSALDAAKLADLAF